MSRGTRYRQLDGLRGAAALVVVFSHVLLVVPGLAENRPPRDTHRANGAVGWFRDTPLHVFWDGEGAVALFFVLSGFVLTLSVGSGVRWRHYYPRRLLRLYGPTVMSVVWAVLTLLVVPRHPKSSWWLTSHAHPWAGDALRSLVLVFGVDGVVNSPLWSLQWEVWFSLLLPVYLFVIRRTVRVWPLMLAVCALAVPAGHRFGVPAVVYMPYFALGMVVALRREQISRWLRLLPQTVWVVIGLALMSLRFIPQITSVTIGHLGLPLGVTLIVAALLRPGMMGNLLARPLMHWVGKISFSLYLVHEPIIVTLAQFHQPFAVLLVVAVAASVAGGWLFWRVVENPVHQWIKGLDARPGSSAATTASA